MPAGFCSARVLIPMAHAGSDVDALRCNVGIGARLAIRESATDEPRFAAWKAFPSRAVAPPARSNGSRLPMAASAGFAP